ncbi:hypothetical protein CTheo_2483 [Ceratobasidium theobromae]|uniref:Uncharacterized protein n=1 Tax=Ceratobasidium theobromae TaxID=1582974 RepID=A0A5N5QQN8_9AGAM|nr:hypothetical protein CTheo_2483 [Ceratobasidium theobromae]
MHLRDDQNTRSVIHSGAKEGREQSGWRRLKRKPPRGLKRVLVATDTATTARAPKNDRPSSQIKNGDEMNCQRKDLNPEQIKEPIRSPVEPTALAGRTRQKQWRDELGAGKQGTCHIRRLWSCTVDHPRRLRAESQTSATICQMRQGAPSAPTRQTMAAQTKDRTLESARMSARSLTLLFSGPVLSRQQPSGSHVQLAFSLLPAQNHSAQSPRGFLVSEHAPSPSCVFTLLHSIRHVGLLAASFFGLLMRCRAPTCTWNCTNAPRRSGVPQKRHMSFCGHHTHSIPSTPRTGSTAKSPRRFLLAYL